jgi:hypothetical protein
MAKCGQLGLGDSGRSLDRVQSRQLGSPVGRELDPRAVAVVIGVGEYFLLTLVPLPLAQPLLAGASALESPAADSCATRRYDDMYRAAQHPVPLVVPPAVVPAPTARPSARAAALQAARLERSALAVNYSVHAPVVR